MEPTFKEACLAIQPHFDAFSNKFLNELKEGVFLGDEQAFIKAKHQVELLNRMKQSIKNETLEEHNDEL